MIRSHWAGVIEAHRIHWQFYRSTRFARSRQADPLAPLGVERLGPDIERAERLIDRVAVAEHLQEHAEVRSETLDENLGGNRALGVRHERFLTIEVRETANQV